MNGLAKLVREAELVQRDRVKGDLVRVLRHTPFCRQRERRVGIIGAGSAQLHLAAADIFRDADDGAPRRFGDCRMRSDGICFIVSEQTGAELAGIAGLLDVHLLHVLDHALREHKERGEHHRRQDDGKNGDEIAPAISAKATARECAQDAGLWSHTLTPSAPRCDRPRCGWCDRRAQQPADRG